MIPAQVAFVVLSAMALGGAVLAVAVPNLFRATLGLMLSLVGVAGLFLIQRAEFLAVVQVMVYVGGVSVLIIFAVMLTERGRVAMEASINPRMAGAGALVAAVLGFSVALFVWRAPLAASPAAEVTTRDLGMALLNRYLVPFEAVSLLLLAALIGALYIAREERK